MVDTIVRQIVRQLGAVPPHRLAAKLKSLGFKPSTEDDVNISADEMRRSGVMIFTKEGPSIRMDKTEAFRKLPKRSQNRLRAWAKRNRQSGETIGTIAVPFRATYELGQPRTLRAGERL